MRVGHPVALMPLDHPDLQATVGFSGRSDGSGQPSDVTRRGQAEHCLPHTSLHAHAGRQWRQGAGQRGCKNQFCCTAGIAQLTLSPKPQMGSPSCQLSSQCDLTLVPGSRHASAHEAHHSSGLSSGRGVCRHERRAPGLLPAGLAARPLQGQDLHRVRPAEFGCNARLVLLAAQPPSPAQVHGQPHPAHQAAQRGGGERRGQDQAVSRAQPAPRAAAEAGTQSWPRSPP